MYTHDRDDIERKKLDTLSFVIWSEWYTMFYSIFLSCVLTMGCAIEYLKDTQAACFFGWQPTYIAVVHISIWSVKSTLAKRALARPSLFATFATFIFSIITAGTTAVFSTLRLIEIFSNTKPQWEHHIVAVIVYVILTVIMVLMTLLYCAAILLYNSDDISRKFAKVE